MELIDKVYDRTSCEIEDVLQHQSFDKQDVEILGELIDIVKDVEMIYDYRNKMDGGSYMRERSGNMMPMYGRSSYARGRSMNINNGYSRSDNKTVLLDHLQDVADMAMDENDRKAVERLMQQMMDKVK